MTPEEKYIIDVVKPLLQNPEAMTVERTIDERGTLLLITCGKEDMPAVIGKGGSTAKALRTLLGQFGRLTQSHISLKITDPKPLEAQ